MPEIQAFRGIRYDLGHVGSLSDVVAPPYDVISPDLQEQLYKRHPCNVVRLILNRMEPGDDEANNRYTRAKRFLKNWQAEGVLFTESDPAVYAYHQQFSLEGNTYTRRGFMARMRIEPFGSGSVFPHEDTMSGPKIDRLMLTVVCQANLSQIFALYPDPENQTGSLLDDAISEKTPIEATDHRNVVHRMWPVTDVSSISSLAAAMAAKPVFIADGHHRYETACNYRSQVYDSGFLSETHLANFVLVHFVPMEDPGLVILPSHRLFRDFPGLTSSDLRARLAQCFTTRDGGEGIDSARTVWEDLQTADSRQSIALFTREDRKWTLAELAQRGRDKMAEVAADHSREWQSLDASILHRLIVDSLLQPDETSTPEYVHGIDELVELLATQQFPLAAMLNPATVDQVRSISLAGERMPPKSTYFYPKLLSGLVINPLE
jgi:uncharacterized protein (DUF1015 family)